MPAVFAKSVRDRVIVGVSFRLGPLLFAPSDLVGSATAADKEEETDRYSFYSPLPCCHGPRVVSALRPKSPLFAQSVSKTLGFLFLAKATHQDKTDHSFRTRSEPMQRLSNFYISFDHRGADLVCLVVSAPPHSPSLHSTDGPTSLSFILIGEFAPRC